MMDILVVDDEEDAQYLFKQKFRKEIKKNEIKLYFASSAQEALDLLTGENPVKVVLILSDINMPRYVRSGIID